jgi:fused
LNNLR